MTGHEKYMSPELADVLPARTIFRGDTVWSGADPMEKEPLNRTHQARYRAATTRFPGAKAAPINVTISISLCRARQN